MIRLDKEQGPVFAFRQESKELIIVVLEEALNCLSLPKSIFGEANFYDRKFSVRKKNKASQVSTITFPSEF